MADDKNNIMFGNSFRLHANESTGAKLGKPTELNFSKVTENTLHMRRYENEYGGGRGGGFGGIYG